MAGINYHSLVLLRLQLWIVFFLLMLYIVAYQTARPPNLRILSPSACAVSFQTTLNLDSCGMERTPAAANGRTRQKTWCLNCVLSVKLLSAKSQPVERMKGLRFHWDFRSVDLDHIVTQAGHSSPFLRSSA